MPSLLWYYYEKSPPTLSNKRSLGHPTDIVSPRIHCWFQTHFPTCPSCAFLCTRLLCSAEKSTNKLPLSHPSTFPSEFALLHWFWNQCIVPEFTELPWRSRMTLPFFPISIWQITRAWFGFTHLLWSIPLNWEDLSPQPAAAIAAVYWEVQFRVQRVKIHKLRQEAI